MPGGIRTTVGTQQVALTGGLSLVLAWGYVALAGSPSFYLAHHVSFSALALCLALVRPLRTVTARPGGLSWVAVALCAVGSLCVCAGESLGLAGGLFDVAAGMACGLGSAVLLARWFLALCYGSVRTSVVYVLVAFAGCAAVRLGLLVLREASPIALGVVLALLPIASLVLLDRLRLPVHQKAWASGAGGGTLQPSREVPRFFRSGNAAFLVFEVAVFGLAMGVTRANFSHWSLSGAVGLVSQALQILVPLALYWWFSVRGRAGSAETGVRALIVLAAVGVLALFVFGNLMNYALSILSLCASTLVLILMYIRMLDAVNRSAAHPFVVFGLVRGSLEIAIVVGSVGSQLLCGAAGMALLPLDVATFVVGILLILLVNSFSLHSTWEFLDVPRDDATDALDERCAQLAQAYELTQAEADVMRYLCRGRSKKYIAAELAMSEDSVRYHAKRLYRKLDVHTREELMTVAGANPGQTTP